MLLPSRRPRLALAALLMLIAAACGGGAPTGDIDKIQVTLTPFEVVVTNTAGRALFDVKVEVMPVGPASHYTATLPRMDNGEKRNVSHTVFSDRDGVPFSPRNVKVSGVLVTAKDMDGKALKVEVPWKQ